MRDSQVTGRRSVFVGRESELDVLLGGLANARAGRGRFIALAGEAGIGKTRTLEEFTSRSDLADENVLWGRCPEHHGLPAYWPWTQAIARYAEQCDADVLSRALGRGATDLAQLIPVIGERLGALEPPATFDPAQSRLRLFDSIATFLRRAADSEPIVLVLDDLHWADEGSILLLAFLAPELRRSRVLLLGTYRERQMKRSPRLLAEITRVSERILLRGFEVTETADFIRTKAEIAPRQALVAHLHGISQGNPFFLDELVRMLQTEGRLGHDDALDGFVPDEVRQVIRRNLEPLSAEERSLLTTAAVIGYDFDIAQLRAVCELAADALLPRLQAAAEAGVIEEIQDNSGRFRFAHMLIRDAFYGDLAPVERARTHRQVGLALEELYQGARDLPCAELARHFVHAAVLGDAAKALDYAARAGDQALGRLAHEEAVAHFEVALKVQRLGRPDERRELALRLSLAQAQAHSGDHVHARATYERAAERARSLEDATAFARAALGYSFATPGVGAVYPTLVALLEESLRMLGEGDGELRATVLGSLSSALYFSRDAERRDALSAESVAMARRVGDPGSVARALVQRHHVLWRPGKVDERLELCEELIQLANDSGDRQLGLHGQLWRIVDLLEAGDLPALDTHLETFARQSDHARIPLYRWFAGSVQAMRALADGRLAESARLADDALARWQEDALSLSAQTRALQHFMVDLETGRLDEVLDAFVAMAREYPALPAWQSGVALIHAEAGRSEEARIVLDGFAARGLADLPRDANMLSSLASSTLVVDHLEDRGRAELLYGLLLPHADRFISIGFGSGTYGAAARYLGILAALLGRLDDAARHLADALAANTRLGSRPLIAHTQHDYARVLLGLNEKPKAAALLEQARSTAEQLGLTRLSERIAATGDVAPSPRARTVSGTFRREGSQWTLAYDGRTIRVKHAKGNDYLLTLLRSPGRDIHVLDLEVGQAPVTASAAGLADQGVQRDRGSDAGDIIDPQARAAYKRRLSELEAELEEARSFNDLGRIDGLQEEIDSITDELSRAIGLGGRHRKAGSAAERARVNVSRAIAAVLKKITEEHPALGEHLAARVHTGTFCSYTPDALAVVDWQF